ncbi:MAG: type VI secretion system tip protein VgrG, partial [Acinetobacter sp.]|nr:type VI secretion system tip protein VgrG [Acinetobacter sp.]
DDKGQLPDTKKLAGIKSREVKGSGYNQLRFDDTTEQISSQLQSSHGASQLNLGNLSHPKETDTSEGRGQGFELRTDQWGAVRAGQGLLLSTHAQDSASGNHLDATAAKSQLESSLNNSKALSEVAKNQQTDPLEVLERIKGFINTLDQQDPKKADAFKSAVMMLASPNSIALASNEDIHLSADGQISHTAGDSINLSTQKALIGHASAKISLFAAQEGARLFAGKGKVEIQAQGDGADLIARKGIQIISTEEAVYITSPKEIRLIGDGSELKINGSGVFSTTGGLFEVKSGQQKFTSGAKVEMKSHEFKETPCYLTYEAKDLFGNPLANKKYLMILQNGEVIQGITDSQGKTKKVTTGSPENISIYIEDENINSYNLKVEE